MKLLYTISARVEGPKLFRGPLAWQVITQEADGTKTLRTERAPRLYRDRRGLYVNPSGIPKPSAGVEIKERK